jgi:hypothetical protein
MRSKLRIGRALSWRGCAILAAILLKATTAAAASITDPSVLSSKATLVDFESINTGGALLTDVSDPFVIGDLTFTSLTGNLSIFDIGVSGWAANGTEVSGRTLFAGGEPDSAITIDFAHPVSEFLLGWGDPNFAGNLLLAYDASGRLLEQASVALGPVGGTDAAWIGFQRTRNDIARIVVQPDQSRPSGDDYVIDNIYFAARPTAAVPEPSTLLLMACGVATAFRSRLAKRRQDNL